MYISPLELFILKNYIFQSSTYTFAASKANGRPVRYEMMGYDSLLGSHYDKYYVDYFSMTSPVTFKDSVFAAPEGM